MSDGGARRETTRRTFLTAVGAAGSSAALANLAAAGARGRSAPEVVQRLPEEQRKAATGTVLLAGVSAVGSLDAVADTVPAPARVTDRNETLRYLRVDLSAVGSDAERLRVQSAIASHPAVKYTEPERVYATQSRRQSFDSGQYAPRQVRADEVPDTLGSEAVTVAVVDTGVDYGHPDLRDHFANDPGRDFSSSGSYSDPAPNNGEYHGTHVAGIVSGEHGVSNAELVACRITENVADTIPGLPHDTMRAGVVADGVTYAVEERDADVINLSLGGPPPWGTADDGPAHDRTLENACKHAEETGALPVAAAGNAATEQPQYPAAFDEVLSVAALDQYEDLATFSNRGDWIDVAAPGDEVWSCLPSNDHGRKSGTSMAAPVVAGVAALTKAANPGLSAQELRTRLEETAVDVGLRADHQGAGRVDAVRAVDPGAPQSGPDVTIDASTLDTHTEEEVVLRALPSDPDETDDSREYHWRIDGLRTEGERVRHTFDEPGAYDVTLQVVDGAGRVARARETVRVSPGEPDLDPAHTETFTGNFGRQNGRNAHEYDYSLNSKTPSRLVIRAENKGGVGGIGNNVDALDGIAVTGWPDARPYEGDADMHHLLLDSDLFGVDVSGDDGLEVELDAARLDWLGHDGSVDIRVTGGVPGDPGFKETSGYKITVEEYAYEDNDSPTVTLTDRPVVATAGEPAEFAARARNPFGELQEEIRLRWAFGDGEVVETDLRTPGGDRFVRDEITHTYESGGEYEVTVTAVDEHHRSNEVTTTVAVQGNEAPEAAFTVDALEPDDADGRGVPYPGDQVPVAAGETVTLDASDATDPDGSITDYDWSLGDGTTATGRTATHVYDDPGTYTVELTVTDDGGTTATATEDLAVTDDAPDDLDPEAFEGTLDTGDVARHSYEVPDGADEVVLKLAADADFDLYATRDGRRATPGRADRRSRSVDGTERLVLEDVTEVGIAVSALQPGGYTLTVDPRAAGDGSSPGGDDGVPGAGDGRTGGCGTDSVTEAMTGRLSPVRPDRYYEYDLRLAEPCRLAVSLDGPERSDFDLYLTRDGRRPAPDDADVASTTPDSQERAVVDDPATGDPVGILVHTWGGIGDYELSVEEVGLDAEAPFDERGDDGDDAVGRPGDGGSGEGDDGSQPGDGDSNDPTGDDGDLGGGDDSGDRTGDGNGQDDRTDEEDDTDWFDDWYDDLPGTGDSPDDSNGDSDDDSDSTDDSDDDSDSTDDSDDDSDSTDDSDDDDSEDDPFGDVPFCERGDCEDRSGGRPGPFLR